MLQDSISDMITRVRNALLVRKSDVCIPFSKTKWEIAKILKENSYIGDFRKEKTQLSKNGKGMEFDQIVIQLKYINEATGQPVLSSLKRVSKPSRRVYVKKDEMPVVLDNLGIAIISTSHGLMTNKKAKRLGFGGEVLCEIY